MTDLVSKPVDLPDQLSDSLAVKMADAYERQLGEAGSVALAMQMAYQVLRRSMLENT